MRVRVRVCVMYGLKKKWQINKNNKGNEEKKDKTNSKKAHTF